MSLHIFVSTFVAYNVLFDWLCVLIAFSYRCYDNFVLSFQQLDRISLGLVRKFHLQVSMLIQHYKHVSSSIEQARLLFFEYCLEKGFWIMLGQNEMVINFSSYDFSLIAIDGLVPS